ncbi:MAG: hypothetical protein ABFD16_09910, partial [Thermoguttaceae bacterium]
PIDLVAIMVWSVVLKMSWKRTAVPLVAPSDKRTLAHQLTLEALAVRSIVTKAGILRAMEFEAILISSLADDQRSPVAAERSFDLADQGEQHLRNCPATVFNRATRWTRIAWTTGSAIHDSIALN